MTSRANREPVSSIQQSSQWDAVAFFARRRIVKAKRCSKSRQCSRHAPTRQRSSTLARLCGTMPARTRSCSGSLCVTLTPQPRRTASRHTLQSIRPTPLQVIPSAPSAVEGNIARFARASARNLLLPFELRNRATKANIQRIYKHQECTA